MMNNIKYVLLAISLLLVSSCQEEFLNREPLDQISGAQVFNDEGLAQAFLNNIIGELPAGQYNSPGPGYGSAYLLASITDEARSKSGWIPSNSIVIQGAVDPGNINDTGLNIWADAYGAIRKVNQFIEGVTASELSEEFKESSVAKAQFVRTWFYFDLVRRYGDVPLITEVQDLEEDILPTRTPKNEVYDFINQELTTAASELSNKSEASIGELNRQGAIGLNARAMLYAERWSEAAALASQLISGEDNDGLALYEANPDSPEEATDNYRDLFLSRGGNVETLYEITFVAPDRTHQFDRGNWPVRWRNDNGGQTDPTQELVNSFQMQATGLSIDDPGSGYDSELPYSGRDPRFYGAIFYHGAEFSEVEPSRGEPFIDMEWNAFNEGPGSERDGNATITGYLVQKWVDPSLGFAPEGLSITAWQEIRFAEILLIYAEAQNELSGPDASVYEAVNRIRTRAAMPPLPEGLSQEEMRQAIRQERKIELVFENHRWFDLLRWDIAVETLDGRTFNGIRIERDGVPTESEGGPTHVFDPGQLTFTPFEVTDRIQIFPEKLKLLPIPQSELDANPNLTQNPGYQ